MKSKSPENKSIAEILGFLDSKKVQVSVKISADLVDQVSEASKVLDVFICDIYEAALKSLLKELRSTVDAKKRKGLLQKETSVSKK